MGTHWRRCVELQINVFLRSLIMVFFTLGFMLFISWRLALVTLVVVPAIAAISKFFGEFERKISKEAQDALAESNAGVPR